MMEFFGEGSRAVVDVCEGPTSADGDETTDVCVSTVGMDASVVVVVADV